MLEALAQLAAEALTSLSAAADPAALEAWHKSIRGNSGKLKAALGGLKDVPKDQKPAVGARLNQLKTELEAAYTARQTALGGTANGHAGGGGGDTPRIDMTEPGLVFSTALGRRHIILRVREELCEVFARMGFEVASGPELEDDEHNFIKLNIPAAHPARDPIDNFYIDDPARFDKPRMLRWGSLFYACYFLVSLPLLARMDEPPGPVFSPGRAALEALAAGMLVFMILDALALLLGPLVA